MRHVRINSINDLWGAILLWILEFPRLLEEVELEALIPEASVFLYYYIQFTKLSDYIN